MNMIYYLKTLIFAIILLSSYIVLYSQPETIGQEISNIPDGIPETISKGRRYLIENFNNQNYEKVKNIKDFLLKTTDTTKYAAFYAPEYWLILYWTKDYYELINSLSSLISYAYTGKPKSIYPYRDSLFLIIREKSRNNFQQIKTEIYNAQLYDIDKDLLYLHLMYLIIDKDYSILTQDSLNSTSEIFLNKWPNSLYDKIIRKYYRIIYKKSTIGIAMDLGSTYLMKTGQLKNSFENKVSANMSIDFYFKEFVVAMQIYGDASKTKRNFYKDSIVWQKGATSSNSYISASLGYIIKDNSILRLFPYSGIGYSTIQPNSTDFNKYPELKNIKYTAMHYIIGLTADLKLFKPKYYHSSTLFSNNNYFSLRLKYAFIAPQFNKKYHDLSGQIHLFTIGIGMAFRDTNKVY